MKFSLALASLSLIPAVFGHGHMTTLTVDGKDYTGPVPNANPIDSVIRQINDIDPILKIDSDDMSCGNGAANLTATQSASAKPGSTIAVSWISGSPPILWPHVVGPLMTYIADCGGDCSKFNSLDAKWVKIDEAGLVTGDTVAGSGWVQEATFHAGKSYSMKLPSDLADGNYLLRHEIIALHNAQSVGMAEFYPACSQITVSGGGSGKINTDNAVSFPGGYSATDPGIHVDVYSPPFGQYQFPGPAVVTNLATGATDGNSTSGSSSGSSGGSGSGGSSSASTTSTSSSLMPSTTSKPATSNNNSTSNGDAGSSDDSDCDDDGSDDGSSDADPTVTVTETVYITATGNRHVHTATATAFVTVTDSGAAVASASATPSPSSSVANLDGGYPRRRSRIMARHHFASVH